MHYQPTTVGEAADLLADSSTSTICFAGGRTWLGDTDPHESRVINTTGLNRIIDHAADDMTITVEAGVRWQDLCAALDEQNQELPFDRIPAAATIGGRMSVNHAGPLCWSGGTWRDRTLGVEAVDGSGRVFHAGGRVVKNVAGYDLTKLLIGAYGTLGLLTQMTLKVQPKQPLANWTLEVEGLSTITRLVDEVIAGRSTVASISVAGRPGKWAVVVQSRGLRATQILESMKSQVGCGTINESNAPSEHSFIPETAKSSILQMTAPLSGWLNATTKVAELFDASVTTWLGGPIQALLTSQMSIDSTSALDDIAKSVGGRWSIHAGSSSTRNQTAEKLASDRLGQALKNVFDPNGKFRVLNQFCID